MAHQNCSSGFFVLVLAKFKDSIKRNTVQNQILVLQLNNPRSSDKNHPDGQQMDLFYFAFAGSKNSTEKFEEVIFKMPLVFE